MVKLCMRQTGVFLPSFLMMAFPMAPSNYCCREPKLDLVPTETMKHKNNNVSMACKSILKHIKTYENMMYSMFFTTTWGGGEGRIQNAFPNRSRNQNLIVFIRNPALPINYHHVIASCTIMSFSIKIATGLAAQKLPSFFLAQLQA